MSLIGAGLLAWSDRLDFFVLAFWDILQDIWTRSVETDECAHTN